MCNFSQPFYGLWSHFKVLSLSTHHGERDKMVKNVVRQLLGGEKLHTVHANPIPSLLPKHRTELDTSYLLALVMDIFSSTTKPAIDREPNHGEIHQMGMTEFESA